MTSSFPSHSALGGLCSERTTAGSDLSSLAGPVVLNLPEPSVLFRIFPSISCPLLDFHELSALENGLDSSSSLLFLFLASLPLALKLPDAVSKDKGGKDPMSATDLAFLLTFLPLPPPPPPQLFLWEHSTSPSLPFPALLFPGNSGPDVESKRSGKEHSTARAHRSLRGRKEAVGGKQPSWELSQMGICMRRRKYWFLQKHSSRVISSQGFSLFCAVKNDTEHYHPEIVIGLTPMYWSDGWITVSFMFFYWNWTLFGTWKLDRQFLWTVYSLHLEFLYLKWNIVLLLTHVDHIWNLWYVFFIDSSWVYWAFFNGQWFLVWTI